MNWSFEQALEQLKSWEAVKPKQRLYVVFTWGVIRLSSACDVAEVSDAFVVLEFPGGGGIRLPLIGGVEFEYSEVSEASFDVRAISAELFSSALFFSFPFSDARVAIAEVVDNVAMI
jgi:hypothetical protein